MAYRIRKQITISAIVILFLALVGIGIYYLFLKPEPSCFDGILNQEEEEIDCGGPCVSCEITTLKEIEVIWTKTILLEGNAYDLVAQIRNPNPNFGAPTIKYNFELKNGSGQMIGNRQGTTFILPGSSKYIIETNFESQEAINSINLTIEKVERSRWQKLKDYQTPDLFVKDKNFSVLSNQPNYLSEASGVVKNDTSFDFDKVFVHVILFDSASQPIAVSKTEVRTLLAGEGRYFSTKWYFPIQGEVSSLDMKAETNLFLDENYMRKFGVPEEEFQ